LNDINYRAPHMRRDLKFKLSLAGTSMLALS